MKTATSSIYFQILSPMAFAQIGAVSKQKQYHPTPLQNHGL